MSNQAVDHIPVLVGESIEALHVQPKHWYIDATFGGGGHTREILASGGRVIGIDHDQEAIDRAKVVFAPLLAQERLVLHKKNFMHIGEITKLEKKPISGVLFDLGMSSLQLASERGFSFTDDTLDMRMDGELGVTAADLVNALSKDELTRLFRRYGEERNAGRIAKEVVAQRKDRPIRAARELTQIIRSVVSGGRLHPATKVFQALRIAVNDELNSLQMALPAAFELVQPGGRVVAISFHSLEDRLVKRMFRTLAERGAAELLTKRPMVPNAAEVTRNPRSRSAKLRAVAKA